MSPLIKALLILFIHKGIQAGIKWDLLDYKACKSTAEGLKQACSNKRSTGSKRPKWHLFYWLSAAVGVGLKRIKLQATETTAGFMMKYCLKTVYQKMHTGSAGTLGKWLFKVSLFRYIKRSGTGAKQHSLTILIMTNTAATANLTDGSLKRIYWGLCLGLLGMAWCRAVQ